MSCPEDFIIRNGILEKYDGREKNVVIPEGVVRIAESTFSHCSDELVLCVRAGSYAEAFAKENGYRYEII